MAKSLFAALRQSGTLVVFTYAIEGLGHLRVTDTLYDGLPRGIDAAMLDVSDTKIIYWHRLMSLYPFVRKVLKWFQQEKNEYWFYSIYIRMLLNGSNNLYRKMINLLTEKWPNKKTVVVVSTHYGLAQQMAGIKNRLEKDLNIRLILVVQVTDATAIKIWYVEEADLMVVPSKKV
ncbi:MAG: hypothetical protein WC686_00005, partial [Candidatus Shapirobacteria bacterium]